ncbi:MAG: BREX-6 system BrxE protein [Deltaproteobacteria bacterium]|nr:BREX-6 system BrxE protein [Deltaproteobacteria bacterium]
MSAPESRAALDTVLTTQLVVAHAGESCPDQPRLAWWDTDIVSRDGGLDLLRRLYPRTWRWAALRAVRATARAIDHTARKLHAAEPDRIMTLFHLGFAFDEALDDHLDQLAATHPEDPTSALPDLAPHIDLDGRRPFDRDAFEAWLGSAPATAKIETTAIGRRLPPPTSGPTPTLTPAIVDHVLALRAALAPLPASYPLPYFQLP